MQPLFTIHAGEYLVGSHIEQKSDPRPGRMAEYRDKLLSCGWWTLNREKIRKSPTDYWVFVLRRSGISLNTNLFPPVAGCYTGDENTNQRGAYGYCIV